MFQEPVERDRAMTLFFRAGLLAGDYCVVVVDAADPTAMLQLLGSRDEVSEWRSAGLLDIRTATDPTQPANALSVDEMLSMWDAITEEATGFSGAFARLGGEASWWIPRASEDHLIRYESELTRRIPDQLGVLCLYDVTQFGAGVLIDVIRTHPKVLVGSLVVDNPYFIPPDEFLATRRHGGTAPPPTEDEAAELLGAALGCTGPASP
ncbi:MEDS domain-containing protein [Pseudonocardia sp. H11422]|uniref:MEDS domain-containing protein n=1 Tax=Pseudonocardia sp. H11422 TaxID=2835866 RepID=UPI001BDC9A2C|nr:MEDS domain-containing protein [Pseudonocardia sp. H11422]